ncbi:MAG: hypothetical protein P1U65_11105 [Minwuia sp.]|nr:hypothetical protein [Minwuia sp.]
MKTLLMTLTGLFLLVAPAQAETWLEQLDIPLMDGLSEVVEAGTVFESATGRVIVVETTGAVAARSIEGYYEQVLPELGWRADGANRFLRDGELLALTISRAAGLTLVVFRLSPEG